MSTATQPPVHSIDSDNFYFRRALAFVRDTNENLFVTGRAGTGKTTFLRYIRENINKKCAVIAPTGVAAINAGGETIHSFLQLPFTPFVPGTGKGFNTGTEVADKHSLLEKLKLRDSKRNLLRKLELLIIDEVSMVRCDLLDEIDLVLRHVRKNWHQPFGGLQVVFVGDMFQLPPVVPDTDWEILRDYYSSPYFFDAVALRNHPPVYIELKKIYRQKEQKFIDILNNIRNGEVSQRDIDTLNEQYIPGFRPKNSSGFITLSTHNHTVDAINQKALKELNTPEYSFEAIIKNDFNPKNFPTEQLLQLKEGAQVMFIKNDTQLPKRFYNGKIGQVYSVDKEEIIVGFPDDPNIPSFKLEPETWKNMRYRLNDTKGEVEEEEAGSFTQYPVRLAWAVTVHKSQGLTFDKVVVDLNRSFTSGQVYVALSRCTSLGGLVLSSPLNMHNVMVDDRIIAFAQSEKDDTSLDNQLTESMRIAEYHNLSKLFLFTDIIEQVEQLQVDLTKRKTGPAEENRNLCELLLQTFNAANTHGENFGKEIFSLLNLNERNRLNQRKHAAVSYFTNQVLEPCLQRTEQHLVLLSTYKKTRKQTNSWKEFRNILKNKKDELSRLLTNEKGAAVTQPL